VNLVIQNKNSMKKTLLLSSLLLAAGFAMAQTSARSGGHEDLTVLKSVLATPVKNQGMTGTCWCFSSVSAIESESILAGQKPSDLDLSEMFTVRNIYIEKAKNYVWRQGHAQFGEGGLGHDLIRALSLYGAVPESVYTGLKPGGKMHNHVQLFNNLKKYADSILKTVPLPENWLDGYTRILDTTLGAPPANFTFNGKSYTPKTFASEVLKFNPADYVNITSFTHHPYYQPFVIEVPDNFSSGEYYNLPLNEMIAVAKDALNAGHSVIWDADVSNKGFMQERGLAVFPDAKGLASRTDLNVKHFDDAKWDAGIRQQLYENLTTQDDHLMHITGLTKSASGDTYFLVKNSWGDIGPDHGYINVSEGYFAINTISLVVPKAALSKQLLEKLKVK
jgi:bleomycin hydrolase